MAEVSPTSAALILHPVRSGLAPGQAVDFTFWWPEAGRWEGHDLRVGVTAAIDRP